ncbi:uncharacterized protein FMAN_00034 [Fusarium mangiferae]|uniref:Uncharacterized protein n=1 Tax=Fusarium mangiferae TaxID=192010 RepID=A0A1L7TVA9_FUSMA|nr:uncharacterized protein FMAN_00034 [Fusarium mangiferae]CVL02518.1 uncharacterized protein FMAN_00034 [Fusarium mangiferae]
MKYSLILALWSVGALGGPCNPTETPGSVHTSGGLEGCNDELSENSSTSLVVSLPGQDVVVETSVTTESPDDENGQATVSVRPTETTQAFNGQETVLVSPGDTEPTADDSAPTTTAVPSIIGQTSGDATSAVATDAGSVDTETAPIPIDSKGPPTSTVPNPDPATDSQPAEQPVTDKTTALGSDSTSAVGTPSEGTQTEEDNGAHTTTHGEDATSKPTTNYPDTSSAQVSPGNDQSSNVNTVTTASATATQTRSDDTPTTSNAGDDGPTTKAQSDDIPLITQSPGTTANDAKPAPTITDAPDGLAPTTVGGHPEWVSNTWITTTGDNSETTVVPVLVGCPGCGGKGSGIVLFGFPKTTGTWFKLPGLPKFKFPCIPPFCTTSPDTPREGDDGDDDDDDDKSSATTCTDKATVTDCFVACTTYTGPAGSTITAECKTTCTKTHTGCDVVGTTTTSSAAACGPSGDSACQSCERKLVSEVQPEESEEGTEEDSDENDLEKRAPKKKKKPFVNVGGCGKLAKNPKFPEYLGGPTILNLDENIIPNDSPLKDIKRWWLTTIDENCSPGINGNLPATKFSSRLNGGTASIDHVYEKSMLLDYFKHIIDTTGPDVKGATDSSPRDKISCNDIKAYGGANADSNDNLLQKVFDAYPGVKKSSDNNNPTAVESPQYLDDFIGMDQWTNGDAKGFVANAEDVLAQCDKLVESVIDVKVDTSQSDAETRIERKLGRLEKIAIGIAMFSVSEAKEAMIRQNHRIHARLIDIDNNAKGCMDDPAVKNGIWSFAKAYKTFMASRFDGTETWSINNAADYGKTKLIEKLTSDLAAASSVAGADSPQWQAKIGQWKAMFKKMTDSTVWAVPVPDWTWETTVAKRDGDGLSCKRPIPTFTSSEEPTTLGEPTTFATSVRTTSEGPNTEEPSSEEPSSSQTTTSSSVKPGPTIGQRPGWLTDAPTLTDRISPTISTPEGSSCTKTVTETMCNLGTGRHGPACVTHSRCDSWVNTKTTSKPSPSPTLASPKFSENILRCNKSGQASNPNAISYAAQSFCRDIVAKNKNNGYYWSNDRLEGKKVPSTGYHFQLDFSVRKNCLWKANYDECMKYMNVAIDGCNGRSKSDKLGGWVRDNCIEAIINPKPGI